MPIEVYSKVERVVEKPSTAIKDLCQQWFRGPFVSLATRGVLMETGLQADPTLSSTVIRWNPGAFETTRCYGGKLQLGDMELKQLSYPLDLWGIKRE